MKIVHMIMFLLVIIGALNWGLIGLFDFNLIHAVFLHFANAEKVVYALVGAAGIVLIITHKRDCRICGVK